MGHVNIGIIFLLEMMRIQHSVNSDWLFNTCSRMLQADWFMLGIIEKELALLE